MADAGDLLFYRGIERWMVVVGGLIYAYLGYRLFLYGVDQGNGKLEAENQFFKFTFSGSGPGLFFMAFGGMILIASVYSTTEWSETSRKPATPADGATAAQPTVVERKFHYTALGGDACEHLRLSKNNDDPRDAIDVYSNLPNARIAEVGRSLKRLDDADLAAIVPAIEALLCD